MYYELETRLLLKKASLSLLAAKLVSWRVSCVDFCLRLIGAGSVVV